MKEGIFLGKKNYILGIETSCDETAAAVVADGNQVLSNIISSQVDLHRKYGGVVPEIASRKHLEIMDLVIKEALETADLHVSQLHGVAVTYGPGLVGSLLIGIVTAKTLAWSLNIPLIGVNHILAHVYANLLEHEEIETPLLCLTVSGGHTDLLYLEEWGKYEVMGRSRDDAAGEAFDKVARYLGLSYPGGPEIEKLAREGDASRFELPLPVLENSFDFSFSGLKTAVINLVHNMEQKGLDIPRADVAAVFQKTVAQALINKVVRGVEKLGVGTVLLSGGVAANGFLRAELKRELDKRQVQLFYPSLPYCTDNGAMIACAGYYLLQKGIISSLTLDADPSLTLSC